LQDLLTIQNVRKRTGADRLAFGHSGLAYTETANLDGETNLKVKVAFKETVEFQEISELRKVRALSQHIPGLL
jgi:hypothetical protein